MIMPTKHINFANSLLGLGSYILIKLEQPLSIDDLWNEYCLDLEENRYFARHGFENIVRTILFLHTIGLVSEKEGLLEKCG